MEVPAANPSAGSDQPEEDGFPGFWNRQTVPASVPPGTTWQRTPAQGSPNSHSWFSPQDNADDVLRCDRSSNRVRPRKGVDQLLSQEARDPLAMHLVALPKVRTPRPLNLQRDAPRVGAVARVHVEMLHVGCSHAATNHMAAL
eukprot:CAMPEP_0202861314 /NCGR_PEP_ID=MMETSP1391-20130828/2755_1 /ASSEMBLY_ACC=CAM_ASM_000867 /TAXON_ID=1034604 /ORGANISM="Chlamydomonas leiostraca, Strain SAG 11-49" /LENGTH=142 /DNA_ID=CAMNT_0049540683 /DNA_START=100 /DNA_END=528 /DNA_ORIENTATION=-